MGAIRAKRPKKTEVSNNFGFAYPASSFSRLPDKTHKAGFPLVLAKVSTRYIFNFWVVSVRAISVGKRSIELAP